MRHFPRAQGARTQLLLWALRLLVLVAAVVVVVGGAPNAAAWVLVLWVPFAATFWWEHRSIREIRSALREEADRSAQLLEADDLKNAFLAAVSHELRTPLTSILGFAVTLLDHDELPEAQRATMLRTLVVEAEHLEDILCNLLDLDRLTRGKATLVLNEVDARQVVERGVAHVRRRNQRPITMHLGADPVVARLDAAKVERIIENLVGNAVKYTAAESEIDVWLSCDEREVLVRVDDAGVGIASELRETIFEPFRRGADVGVPGTGIGLSLVDHFSRMHGGRVWVEERPGGGCRFQVSLPMRATPTFVPVDDIADRRRIARAQAGARALLAKHEALAESAAE